MAPIFLLTLTGVILVYPSESRTILVDGFGDKVPARLTQKSYKLSGESPSWSKLIEIAQQNFPGSDVRSVVPGSGDLSIRRINLQQSDEWHRLGQTSLGFDSQGVVTIKDALEQPLRTRLIDFSYPLHTSKLGVLYKVFLTLVGLGFALICILGLFSFAKGLFVHAQRPE